MKKLLILLLLIINSEEIFCQLKYPFEAVRNMEYFEGYAFLTDNKNKYIGTDQESYYWQALATLYAFLGKYDKAIEYYKILYANPQNSIKVQTINITNDTCSQIRLSDLYSNYNVVLFNEAHNISKHRAFLFSQLNILYHLGYRYLALEALNNVEYRDSLLEKRGYPIYQKTGIYIDDPIYGLLIREALKLGFKLIPYDIYDFKEEKDREVGQAMNIINQVDLKNGKLVVLGGFGHICESPSDEFMGYFLKENIKQDVLSISQLVPRNIDLLYNHSSKSTFYLFKKSDCYDYNLFTSTKNDTLNIPGWYSWLPYKYSQFTKLYSKKIQYPTLIQVFNVNEMNGVPVYQYIIENEEDILVAYPEKGEYYLRITNSSGSEGVAIN